MRTRFAALLIALLAAPLSAPTGGTGADALRVFLECAFDCGDDHLRREIDYVNWVREPQDAQVHVILTAQRAGAGGFRFVFDFAGREELDGLTDRFTHVSLSTDVSDEIRNEITHTVELGLVRYATAAGFGGDLSVVAESGEEEGRQGPPESDPWDFWVFNVRLSGSTFDEDKLSTRRFFLSTSANRTTDAWRLDLSTRLDLSRTTLEVDDTTTIEDDRDTWRISGSAIRAIGEHWGTGAEIEANNSVRLNRDLLVGAGAALEWNLFPYAESTRRALLARYLLASEYVDYETTTIFGKDEEVLLRQAISLVLSAREAWGTGSLSASWSQFLHDTDFRSLDFRGRIDYRIIRGVSVGVSASHEIIDDQIFLSAAGLSEEEILLRRRQQQTDSRTRFSLSLNYRLGSIFNNAVNTRLSRGVL